MSQKEQIIITLDNDTPAYAKVDTVLEKSRSTKTISVEALTQVLGKHATRTSPILPNRLVRFKERASDNVFMTQVPSHRRTVNYVISDKTHTYDIMVPNLVLFTRFERVPGTEQVRFLNSMMIATKQPVMSGLEDAFLAPFGNIYNRSNSHSRNHEICWGSSARLGSSAKMIDMHVDIFFLAAFNTDLDTDRFNDHMVNDFRVFKTNHLYDQMNRMFKDGSTEEEVLTYLHTHMKSEENTNVNTIFELV